MPSQRNVIENVNGSKNTRMEMDKSFEVFDFRKDEIMHLFRYNLGAQTMVDLAKKLKRPIRVLDIGCGEVNTVRLFYKSFIEKKSDIIEEYTGIDIDYKMADHAKEKYGRCYKACNVEIMIQDLTVEPTIDADDDYYDLIICFEFLEHINPDFARPILKEAYRVLNPDGKAIFSTPNSNGSNAILPKDHFYEYSYEELIERFETAGFNVEDSVGVCVNISRIPAEEKEDWAEEIDRIYKAFGQNSSASAVAVAPLFSPKYCKNVVYHLSKE